MVENSPLNVNCNVFAVRYAGFVTGIAAIPDIRWLVGIWPLWLFTMIMPCRLIQITSSNGGWHICPGMGKRIGMDKDIDLLVNYSPQSREKSTAVLTADANGQCLGLYGSSHLSSGRMPRESASSAIRGTRLSAEPVFRNTSAESLPWGYRWQGSSHKEGRDMEVVVAQG